ncbi:MAG: NADH-quinone oxidoreductase subunit L [Acidimicrobiales bacterium]
MLDLVWLIPALPLAGFLLLVAFGRRLGEPAAGWLATLMVAGSFGASVVVFLGLLDREEEARRFEQVLFDWLPSGGLHVEIGFLADPLSITMALFVTGISALIHLYSIGYMHGDRDFSKFFIYLNLFVFSMLCLVLANNFLLTFLGWEGVGTCSYLLISFWFTDEANAAAGKKAFVTNRIGDFGFMLAMFVMFGTVGSLNYLEVLETPIAAVTVSAVSLLLFLGACGKSAQLPLYVWLPDAMAGPTPVSALIHAATMVTAGVFLMTRVSPLLAQSWDWVPDVVAWVGVITALFAATIAVAQNDIKKILAYSTISQLGYMFLAVGTGAYVAAIFHMVTHAFFKALLFLGSGSVIHGMHDEQDIQRMGGLRKFMPITAVTFIIGWLAIAGVPPFAGFWSKDEILLFAWADNKALWAIGLATALLTAFYMSRQVFLVFFGEKRFETEGDGAVSAAGDHSVAAPHESPWTMALPLVLLAGLSIVGGGLNLPFNSDVKFMEQWLHPVLEFLGEPTEAEIAVSTEAKVALAVVATIAGLLGIVAASLVYIRKRVKAVEPELLAHGWYYDESISSFVAGPGRAAFEGVEGFDRTVVDGSVVGLGRLVSLVGSRLRLAQTGYVRNYALGVAVGAVILVGLFLGRAGV